MKRGMMRISLLTLLIGIVSCFEYEHVEDTCNRLSRYMLQRSHDYSQTFADQPADQLNICPSGPTCCNRAVEELFYNNIDSVSYRVNFLKNPYIARVTRARDNIVDFMSQVLTLTSSSNGRTQGLVASFVEMSKYEIQRIDTMKYPVFVLLDVAQSYGVNKLLNSTNCIAEMRDYLHPLAKMQTDALKIARFLYQAMPITEEVLGAMSGQSLSSDCINQLVQMQLCNQCRDSTAQVSACRGYCLTVARECFSHITAVSADWEQFVGLITMSLDKLDRFAKLYEAALTTSIREIMEKLRDTEIADMCGYDPESNLANRSRRAASTNPAPSKARTALLNEQFLSGMLGSIDQTYCQRYSTEEIKCWNGTEVAPYRGNSGDTGLLFNNNSTATPELVGALEKVTQFNEQFSTVESITIEGVQYNIDFVTEEPEFVKEKSGAAVQGTIVSLVLFIGSLLLH